MSDTDSGLTGPLKIPKEEQEKWYHRLKDVLHFLQLRKFGIGVHPDNKALMVDMLERLKEDETWPHDDVPPLVVTAQIKRSDILPVDTDTIRILTLRDVNNAATGFGRYKGLLIPRSDGLHDPWKPTGN